jgi:hypothetical protein
LSKKQLLLDMNLPPVPFSPVRTFATVILLVGLCGGTPIRAEDIYIAQTEQGADTGRDPANAHSVAFFNAASNWRSSTKTSGKIGPGDTVHLVGTITTGLTVEGSGTEGNPITIRFSPGAKLSAPYWPGAAIKLSRKDYITIDGGATGRIGGYDGKPELSNGIIECTDNGTLLGHQIKSSGVGAIECRHLTVGNLVIANMYVRARGTEQKDYGIGVYNADVNDRGITNYRVTNCIIHDAYIGVSSDYGTACDTYEFSYLTVYNCNWGGRNGDRGSKSNTMSGLVVHHNWFHDWKNWDDPARNSFHHNGFFAWANQGTLHRPQVYSNVFGPGFGGRFQTAGIYINTGIIEPLIYNNLFIPGPGEGVGNGFITVDSQRNTTLRIYNNTLVSPTGTGTFVQLNGNTGHQVVDFKNNLCVGASSFVAVYNRTNLTLDSDHNLGFKLKPASAYKLSNNSSASGSSIAEWRSRGYDAHSIYKNPRLDPDFRPAADSPAREAGMNLSDHFTTDLCGATRPTTKAWTIGAYEAKVTISPP